MYLDEVVCSNTVLNCAKSICIKENLNILRETVRHRLAKIILTESRLKQRFQGMAVISSCNATILHSTVDDTVIPVLVNCVHGRMEEMKREEGVQGYEMASNGGKKKKRKSSRRARSSGSHFRDVGVERDGHGARIVAEFQSGPANQVINHSGSKGPSKGTI